MKWVVRIAVVVVVLLLIADFGTKIVVENLAGRAVSSRRGFNGDVDVTFGGFPFLMSLKDRHFDEVIVAARDVRSSGFTDAAVADGVEVRVDAVDLRMEDVTVHGDLWGDDPGRKVVAARGNGRVILGQASLNRLVPSQYDVSLALRFDVVRVTGTFPQGGAQSFDVPSEQVRLDAGDLLIDAPAPVGELRIPLPPLADGVVFDSAMVAPRQLDLTFEVSRLNLSL